MKSTDETCMSIPLTNRDEYAHDSFIAFKKQLYSDENKTNKGTNPSNVSQNSAHKSKVKNVEDEESTSGVDLDRSNFADRKHGGTNDSLGPDHEPETV
ncbi:MAG: hypothetical protein ACYCZO_09890 [Daejeonella sp.]